MIKKKKIWIPVKSCSNQVHTHPLKRQAASCLKWKPSFISKIALVRSQLRTLICKKRERKSTPLWHKSQHLEWKAYLVWDPCARFLAHEGTLVQTQSAWGSIGLLALSTPSLLSRYEPWTGKRRKEKRESVKQSYQNQWLPCAGWVMKVNAAV